MATIRDLMIKLGVQVDTEEGTNKVAAFLDNAKTRFAIGAAGLGAVIGSELSKGFESAINVEAANDKLAAQMGLSGQEAERAGKLAGELYADAYGDSIGQVNDAIRQVSLNIGDLSNISDKDLENVTKGVLDIAKAFDQDLNSVTRATGKLMTTGLAPDAQTAMDLITVAFQQGSDQGGDLLDTINEYSVQFQKLGLDGPTSLGLLSQGLKGGARDADIVADAFKEFSIRAVDGSDTTAAALSDLGLDVNKVSADIAAGGSTAFDATRNVTDALRGVKDPVKQAQIAVGLFGTQAEDLGAALFELDLTTAASEGGFESMANATNQLGATLADNAQTKVLTMQRGFEGWMASMAETDGVIGTIGTALMAFGPQAITMAGSLAMIVSAFGSLGMAALTSIGNVVKSFATMIANAAMATVNVIGSLAAQGAKWLWLGIQSLLHAAKVAAAWLIALGPIGLIIAAVIAVVALIVANWDKIKEIIAKVWEWLKTATKAAWDWVVNTIKAAGQFLVDLFMKLPFVKLIADNWESIKNGVVTAWNWIVDKIKWFLNMIVLGFQVLGKLPEKVWNWFKEMGEGAIKKLGELIIWIKGLPGKITDALGNLGKLLWEKGKQLLEGLWNGLQSMVGWIKDKIIGFFSGLLPDWVKSALGIKSPSKVFAYFGRMSGLGFVNSLRDGLGEALGVAKTAMGSVAGIMQSPLEANLGFAGGAPRGPYGGVPTTPSAPPAVAGGGGVIINGLSLNFADDRNLYEKGQDFAAGLREYKARGGELP